MEFIVANRKYSILDHELYINYLMVDSYFKDHSRYDYDIHFDFLDCVLKKDRITFDDILKGTEDLEILIEKGEISFIPAGLRIHEQPDNTFIITYQTMEFKKVSVGEAIPLLIALNSLLNCKPIVPLFQIEEELNYFLEMFKSYSQD